MFVPKKSKYIHLPSCAYKGRKSLPYYICEAGKPAKYLLLEILNTLPNKSFTDDEIILFCTKCRKKGLEVVDIQRCLYKACIEHSHFQAVDAFIDSIVSKWNTK